MYITQKQLSSQTAELFSKLKGPIDNFVVTDRMGTVQPVYVLFSGPKRRPKVALRWGTGDRLTPSAADRLRNEYSGPGTALHIGEDNISIVVPREEVGAWLFSAASMILDPANLEAVPYP
jgi:hypothetical protein